jgi:hypothetical protein
MGDDQTSTGERPPAPPRDAVARSLGGAYWSVDGHRWQRLRPNLPAELADLLAPPIVVGAVPVAAG